MRGYPEACAKAALLNFLLPTATPQAIVSELALDKWKFRADLVICGPSLTAFEIKTQTDKLSRLDRQIAAYSEVFENVYAVVATRHVANVLKSLPYHVGLLEIVQEGNANVIREIRPAKRSPTINKGAVAKLIPATELRRIIRAEGGSIPASARREILTEALGCVSAEKMNYVAREFLVARYYEATRRFLTSVFERDVLPSDMGNLRLWPAKYARQRYLPEASGDEFFESLSKNNRFAFGEVPADMNFEDLGTA